MSFDADDLYKLIAELSMIMWDKSDGFSVRDGEQKIVVVAEADTKPRGSVSVKGSKITVNLPENYVGAILSMALQVLRDYETFHIHIELEDEWGQVVELTVFCEHPSVDTTRL